MLVYQRVDRTGFMEMDVNNGNRSIEQPVGLGMKVSWALLT